MDKQTEPRTCESCGEEFGCGVNAESCWCFDVTLAEGREAEIAKQFLNCLCPKCLGKFTVRPAMVITYPDDRKETIDGAVRVDTQNYHEGMFDFYDASGNLLTQIEMGSGIEWEEKV